MNEKPLTGLIVSIVTDCATVCRALALACILLPALSWAQAQQPQAPEQIVVTGTRLPNPNLDQHEPDTGRHRRKRSRSRAENDVSDILQTATPEFHQRPRSGSRQQDQRFDHGRRRRDRRPARSRAEPDTRARERPPARQRLALHGDSVAGAGPRSDSAAARSSAWRSSRAAHRPSTVPMPSRASSTSSRRRTSRASSSRHQTGFNWHNNDNALRAVAGRRRGLRRRRPGRSRTDTTRATA